MKILHAYKLYLPDPGGIQTVMQTLVEAAPKTDKVGALVSRRIGLGITEEYEGLKVFRSLSLGTLLAMPLAPFYPFHLLLKSRQVDIVDYHYPFPLVDLAISALNYSILTFLLGY